jgi:hypothetical protein
MRALHVTSLLFSTPIRNKTYFTEPLFCIVNNKDVKAVWGAFNKYFCTCLKLVTGKYRRNGGLEGGESGGEGERSS